MISPSLLIVLGACLPSAAPQEATPEPARYVRIELEGADRILSLAEVQIFSGGESIAVGAKVEQSSESSGGAAERAVDGNTDGVYTANSVTHTSAERDPWWEVDLGEELLLERIVVWNRTDCCEDRLNAFSLQLLDKRHKLIWERTRIHTPRHHVEILPFQAAPAPLPEGPTAEERRALQPRIGLAIDEGVRFLLKRQMWDGSFRQHSTQYPAGSTGLALYTLLKCGVPRTHPAVVRGVNYLLANPPSETYELGTVLMALGALEDPEHQPLMEQLLEELLAIQGAKSADGRRDDLWAYPRHSDLADLSNTQYAALGLRAAHKAGLKVPPRAWQGLIEGVLRFQEEPRVVEDTITTGKTTSGELRIAGFPYRAGAKATASMTTAGLGILGICEEGWDSMPARLGRQVQLSKQLAIGWLTYNFSVTSNVAGDNGRLLYYLYGLERVGALLGIERFGVHDWYWEGAKKLVGDQGGNGSWATDNESNTCFALLFLSRATANPTTGVEVDRGTPEGTWIAEHPADDVQWRITGGGRATIFISGFSEAVIEDFAVGTGSARGLRVRKVEYSVEGEVVATLSDDGKRRWAGQRFAARHLFEKRGSYSCEVRVWVQDPDLAEETVELVGDPLVVKIKDAHDEALLDYPRQASHNLLRNTEVIARASSANSEGQKAGKAVDGFLGSGWVSTKQDPRPTLTLELRRAQRGRRLLLSQVNVNEFSRGSHDRATRVRVVLNGKGALTFEVEVPPADEEKLVLELEKAISLRKLEITILERKAGAQYPGNAGISEVEWLAR